MNRRRPAAVSLTAFTLTLATLATLTTLSSCATFNRNDVAAKVGDRSLSAHAAEALAATATPATGDQLREELTKWIRVSVLEASTGTAAPTTAPTTKDLDTRLSQALLTVAGDKAKTAYAAGVNGSPFICLAAITVATIDDANRVLATVNSGTSFSDAAHQFSTDTAIGDAGGVVKDQSGNECLDPGTLNPPLITALKNATVGQPLAAELGSFAAVVMLRPFEDLLPASQASIASATVSQEQLDALVSAAKIYVDPRYGRWDPATGAVVTLTS